MTIMGGIKGALFALMFLGMPADLFSQIGQFFRDLRQSFVDGLLFFGGPLDTVVAILDILATTFILYYVLKLFRDSRAWQLMKGVILILALTLLSNVVGLNAIGFLLNSTISILAIAVLVLFQPELRRTLETVGRNSFGRLTGSLIGDTSRQGYTFTWQMVESIVSACESMRQEKTGALIIIERATKLGDLAEQENAVQLDAAVTTALLKQIFYGSSPLHDGAVLIRNGRIAAARVHMPLSDNYHLRREFGTRHRAAVGASEMGDAIAIVVSEERGVISLAIDGRLYVLSNADALRSQLHRLLMSSPKETRASRFGRLFGRNVKLTNKVPATAPVETIETPDAYDAGLLDDEEETKPRFAARLFRRRSTDMVPRRQRVLLFVLSLFVASGLWLYVQVTVNPIDTKTIPVTLSYRGTEEAEANGFMIQTLPVQTVQLTLTARKQILDELSARDITAYVDVGKVTEPGVQQLPVVVATDTLLYTQTDQLTPTQITVNVFERSAD